MTEPEIENLYNTMLDQETVKESFTRRTVPTGEYILQAERADLRPLPDNFEHGGTTVLTVSGTLYDNDGNKIGRSPLFDVTWHRLINSRTGKQERMTSLFTQIAVALDLRNKSVGEIRDGLLAHPVRVYINESAKGSDGRWAKLSTPDERKAAFSSGAQMKNFVENVKRVTQ